MNSKRKASWIFLSIGMAFIVLAVLLVYVNIGTEQANASVPDFYQDRAYQSDDPLSLVLDQTWAVSFHPSPRSTRGCFSVYRVDMAGSSDTACVDFVGSLLRRELTLELEEALALGEFHNRYTVLLNATMGYRCQITVPIGNFNQAATPSIDC